jgi:hypothetical protein
MIHYVDFKGGMRGITSLPRVEGGTQYPDPELEIDVMTLLYGRATINGRFQSKTNKICDFLNSIFF